MQCEDVPPPVSNLPDLKIYIEYDGKWVLEQSGWLYCGGNGIFFLVNKDINYPQFVQRLREEIGCDPTIYDLKMTLAPQFVGCPPVTVTSERTIMEIVQLRAELLHVNRVIRPSSSGSPVIVSSRGSANHKIPESVDRLDKLVEEDPVVDLTKDDIGEMLPPESKLSMGDQSRIRSPIACSSWKDPRFIREDLVCDILNTTGSYPFVVGTIFPNFEELKLAVSKYAMENTVDFRVRKSAPYVWYVKCLGENCGWKLRGKLLPQSGPLVKIVSSHKEHTCSLAKRTLDHRQAAPRVVGKLMMDRFSPQSSATYAPRNLQADMKKLYGVTMSYEKAWRCKEKAVGFAMGTPEDSYSKLPQYLYMLKERNPGTVTDFQTDSEGRFSSL